MHFPGYIFISKSSLIPLYRWRCYSKSRATSEHILQVTQCFEPPFCSYVTACFIHPACRILVHAWMNAMSGLAIQTTVLADIRVGTWTKGLFIYHSAHQYTVHTWKMRGYAWLSHIHVDLLQLWKTDKSSQEHVDISLTLCIIKLWENCRKKYICISYTTLKCGIN